MGATVRLGASFHPFQLNQSLVEHRSETKAWGDHSSLEAWEGERGRKRRKKRKRRKDEGVVGGV